MPKFQLPPEKPNRTSEPGVASGPGSPAIDYQRRVTLPVNKAILNSIETGDFVRVVLEGKVEGEISRAGEFPERSITVSVRSVEAYPTPAGKDEDNAALEAGFERPYDEG